MPFTCWTLEHRARALVLTRDVTTAKRRARVRAPELAGRGWLNTGGKAVTLAELRGRITLLDFWTFCCINCLHVLDELRPLEAEFEDVLVTIGVHSPKFVHEADPDALKAAVERYEVHHPVLDDPELTTWQNYAVKAWPTLVLVDPEGYVVHVAAGEGHVEALRRVIAELVDEHEAKGTLRSAAKGRIVPPQQQETELRFPAKIAVTPQDTLLVADIGAPQRGGAGGGRRDGHPALRHGRARARRTAARTRRRSRSRRGLPCCPRTSPSEVGYDVVVADTVNHLLRGINLSTGKRHDGRRHRRAVAHGRHRRAGGQDRSDEPVGRGVVGAGQRRCCCDGRAITR